MAAFFCDWFTSSSVPPTRAQNSSRLPRISGSLLRWGSGAVSPGVEVAADDAGPGAARAGSGASPTKCRRIASTTSAAAGTRRAGSFSIIRAMSCSRCSGTFGFSSRSGVATTRGLVCHFIHRIAWFRWSRSTVRKALSNASRPASIS